MNLRRKSLSLLVLTNLTFANLAQAKTETKLEQIKNWGLSWTDAILAWPLTKGNQEIVVAIIDTGVDTEHPTLKESLWVNPGETGIDAKGGNKANNGMDDDGNGFIDDVHGWNFAGNSNDLRDDHGHGTHVAGIIHSIAPKTNLMILKFFDPKASGAANLANTIRALAYAVQMKARIINYSGGGTEQSPQEKAMVAKTAAAGILLVAAAGNEHANSDQQGFYPADYGFPNTLSVTALDENNKVLSSSNYGVNTVDIAAPGKNISSSIPGGGFAAMTGTSQATAFVSGAAALFLADNPEVRAPERVITALTQSGFEEVSLQGKTKYETRLNIFRSLIMKDQDQEAFGTLSNNSLDAEEISTFDDSEPLFSETPFTAMTSDKIH